MVSEWDGMALAWFSQVIIAAERLTRAMRYALARRATCPGAKLSRACSRMLACGLCAIGCREAGVPVDHAGATRGVYPARCFHPGRAWAVRVRAVRLCVRACREMQRQPSEQQVFSLEQSTVNCHC